MRALPAALLLALVLAPFASARAQTTPVVVVEAFFSCGATLADGLVSVDPTTGNRRMIVGLRDDGGVCTTVGTGALPLATQRLGWDPSGAVWVADVIAGSSRLLRITYPDGVGAVVSGCTAPTFGPCLGAVVGSGPLGTLLGDVVTITSATASPPTLVAEDVVVAMSLFSTCSISATSLVRIDPNTGDRTILSGLLDDCQNIRGTGDPFLEVNGLFATDTGTILVADGDGGVGRLIEVDPATGDRTVVSGCDTAIPAGCIGSIVGAGPVPEFAHSVAPLDASASTIASRMPPNAGVCFGGTILEIDRASGDRTLLSGEDAACVSVGAGEPFVSLEAVASLPSFDLVTSEDIGVDRIFRIDGTTGERTVLSGCTTYAGLSCAGPTIGTGVNADGYGVLVVPEPSVPLALLGGALWIALRERRRGSSQESPREARRAVSWSALDPASGVGRRSDANE